MVCSWGSVCFSNSSNSGEAAVTADHIYHIHRCSGRDHSPLFIYSIFSYWRWCYWQGPCHPPWAAWTLLCSLTSLRDFILAVCCCASLLFSEWWPLEVWRFFFETEAFAFPDVHTCCVMASGVLHLQSWLVQTHSVVVHEHDSCHIQCREAMSRRMDKQHNVAAIILHSVGRSDCHTISAALSCSVVDQTNLAALRNTRNSGFWERYDQFLQHEDLCQE